MPPNMVDVIKWLANSETGMQRGQEESSWCRFAPSITGFAHPGTLLAGLLSWLDARSRSDAFCLRLEDLDVTRVRPGWKEGMLEALQWLGLDWDQLVVQSEQQVSHENALDRLEAKGLLYPCICSRRQWQARGQDSPDGGIAYDNQCRTQKMPRGGWRDSKATLRVKLPLESLRLIDESGLDLSQCPAIAMGDPVVRRQDGVLAYHLVVVVDDAAAGIGRVVRGRDLASSTATQYMLQTCLALPHPSYRHHFLLLEQGQDKLAKYRGSLPFPQLQKTRSGAEMCGHLAKLAGLHPSGTPCTPQSLVSAFDWGQVRAQDLIYQEEEAV